MTTTSGPSPRENEGAAHQPGSMPTLRRGQRMSDAERATVGRDLLRRYEAGASIRELCRETGYSIGRVRRLLEDAGVTYRRRGGANRSPAPRPETSATEQPVQYRASAEPTVEPSPSDAGARAADERPADDDTAR